jgi:thymidylate synthase (FAD)
MSSPDDAVREEARHLIAQNHAESVRRYEQLVEIGEALGATRKESRQAARCVLPGGTETRIVVSGNVRAWRDFILQRFTEHADDEIREVSSKVLAIIREHAPNSVSDISETPYV